MQKSNGEVKSSSSAISCSSCFHICMARAERHQLLCQLPTTPGWCPAGSCCPAQEQQSHRHGKCDCTRVPSWVIVLRTVPNCARIYQCWCSCAVLLFSLPELLLSFWSYTSKPSPCLPLHSHMQILKVCEGTLQDLWLSPWHLLSWDIVVKLRLTRIFQGFLTNTVCQGGVSEDSRGLLRCSSSQRKVHCCLKLQDLTNRVMCGN